MELVASYQMNLTYDGTNASYSIRRMNMGRVGADAAAASRSWQALRSLDECSRKRRIDRGESRNVQGNVVE